MIKALGNYFYPDLTSRLIPGSNVVGTAPGSEYLWESTSDDPQFGLDGVTLKSGWYMLELLIRHSCPSADARIYFDSGNGFNEAESAYLPVKCNRVTKRLVYLPKKICSLRFDPIESKGFFSVEHFRFVGLAQPFAMDRLYQRLASMHDSLRGCSKAVVKKRLVEEARKSGEDLRDISLVYYNETFVRRRQSRDYQHWIDHEEQSQFGSDGVAYPVGDAIRPLVSIIVPTYNSNIRFLQECIDSVRNQTYENWELCIADDSSTVPGLSEFLQESAASDARIKVVFREKNGHISAASNTALSVAAGDYIALLDHDDVLSPYALERVMARFTNNSALQFVYTDEDKVDELGVRFDPHFKPGWNPDLLLSQNYICHFSVFSAELVRKVGGFRVGFEGSQDHDLLLRCLPYLTAEAVARVPLILYHWRAMEGSTALEASGKTYTSDAGLRAVQECVDSIGVSATVELGSLPNTYRVKRHLPDTPPLVSLLIPTRDGVDILQPCVDAILQRTEYTNFEVLILDNQSSCPKTLEYLRSVTADSRVEVFRWDHPFNYSAINNFGASKARGDIIALINNDIEPINGEWLSEMVTHVLREEIGCVGAKLYYPDDSIQHAGVILGIGGVAGHAHKYFSRHDYGYFSRLHLVQNLSAVTAACLLVRRDVFSEVGGLDEDNLSVSFNDVDFCLKVRAAGYRNLWTPYAELYHHESVSRGADDTTAKRRRADAEATYMKRKWGAALNSDPAYNPNLTLIHEDFSLA